MGWFCFFWCYGKEEKKGQRREKRAKKKKTGQRREKAKTGKALNGRATQKTKPKENKEKAFGKPPPEVMQKISASSRDLLPAGSKKY